MAEPDYYRVGYYNVTQGPDPHAGRKIVWMEYPDDRARARAERRAWLGTIICERDYALLLRERGAEVRLTPFI